MGERPEWFAPKRYGVGAGMPIAWQGWVVTAVFVLIVASAFFLAEGEDRRAIAFLVPALIGYVVIAAWTTKGGWRWRWGDED